MPGVEQASPSGLRAQTTQPSVHSEQAGTPLLAARSDAGVTTPAKTAKATTRKAMIPAMERARDSSRLNIAHPNAMRPARPAAPTMIRHQAKGVKPWRET